MVLRPLVERLFMLIYFQINSFGHSVHYKMDELFSPELNFFFVLLGPLINRIYVIGANVFFVMFPVALPSVRYSRFFQFFMSLTTVAQKKLQI